MKSPNHNILDIRRRAAHIVRMIVMVVVLLGVMGTGSLTAYAQDNGGAASVELQSRFDDLKDHLAQLRGQRRDLETRYDKITQRISAAKRGGAGGQLLKGIQLESLLEQGRELAERLNGHQEQIRQVETALEYSRQELLASYQGQIEGLERTILTATTTEERTRAINAINTLKRQRHAYSNATPTSPDLDLKRLPTINDSADPEELAAAAAEIDDTERKLQSHIATLGERIEGLERDKRLRQRARDFQDEESFFDESSRNRRVARSPSRVVGGVGDAGGSGKAPPQSQGGAGAESEPTSDSGGADRGSADVQSPPDSSPEPSPGAGAEGDSLTDSDNDGTGEATNGASDPSGDDFESEDGNTAGGGNLAGGVDEGGFANVPEPGVGPLENLPSVGRPDDPFGTAGVVVAPSDIDRGGAQGGENIDSADLSLDGRMNKLKREKRLLEKKASELRKRSLDLKRRANEL